MQPPGGMLVGPVFLGSVDVGLENYRAWRDGWLFGLTPLGEAIYESDER